MLKDNRFTLLSAATINCVLSRDCELQTVGAALASNIARFKVSGCISDWKIERDY